MLEKMGRLDTAGATVPEPHSMAQCSVQVLQATVALCPAVHAQFRLHLDVCQPLGHTVGQGHDGIRCWKGC